MTDAEIMKGVKLCNGDLGNCKECPFDSIGKTCGIELAKAEIGLIERLQTENAALKERLEKAVELPCKVGDTIYEATSVGIYEWEVESVYLRKNIFQANCVNKNDYKMHWNFIKADYCNEFEGKGRVRVNRLEAEARLKEIKENNNG